MKNVKRAHWYVYKTSSKHSRMNFKVKCMRAHGLICESLRNDAPAQDLKVPPLLLVKFENMSSTCANYALMKRSLYLCML